MLAMFAGICLLLWSFPCNVIHVLTCAAVGRPAVGVAHQETQRLQRGRACIIDGSRQLLSPLKASTTRQPFVNSLLAHSPTARKSAVHKLVLPPEQKYG